MHAAADAVLVYRAAVLCVARGAEVSVRVARGCVATPGAKAVDPLAHVAWQMLQHRYLLLITLTNVATRVVLGSYPFSPVGWGFFI